MPKLLALSYAQHEDLAPQIHSMRDFVFQMQKMFGNAYGVTSKEYKFVCEIDGLINKLRDRLDERAFREAPTDKRDAALALYYPGEHRIRSDGKQSES